MNWFSEIIHNRVLFAGMLSWFIAQFIKVIPTLITERRFDFTRFFGNGGMPSSHTSFMVAVTTGVGKNMGFNSAQFALALAVTLIIMADASGVRRAVGKQATALNEIMERIHKHQRITDQKLKELIGHTPFEVIVGAILGIIMGALI